MDNFVDTSEEDKALVVDIIEDLRVQFPDVSVGKRSIPYKNFHLLKDYQGIKYLNSVIITQGPQMIEVIFLQTESFTGLRRDGSATSTNVQAFVMVTLPEKFGHVFIKEETFADKLQEIFQPLETDFKDDPAFSRRFYMLAKDQEKGRQLANQGFRTTLKNTKVNGIFIEVLHDLLLITNKKGVADEDLKNLISLGLSISAIRC